MGFNKEKIRQVRWLMVLAAALVLALMYSSVVFKGVAVGVGIIKPFIIGGAIAFVLNIPMRGIENTLFKKWKGKSADRLKRPVCMVLAIVVVVLIINLVIITVVPQVTKTAGELGNKIPVFVDNVITELNKLSRNYPQLQEYVAELQNVEVNWDKVVDSVVSFLKSGVVSVLSSTYNVASSIIGGVVNGVISFIFALYILSQKEKLASQGRRILSAYLPKRAENEISHVLALLYRNFSNFITGQCLEAVILGTMFVIAMTIFRMPYAVMVGVLIAFTALIPIVGAFIGCFVGAFLILINNPIQAVWFVILFLVLQQIEGNLIYPKVVGSSVGLPSIWVLMAVSVGGSLFGIAGMLFFIPLLSTVYSLLRDSVNTRNERRSLAGPGAERIAGGPGSGRPRDGGRKKHGAEYGSERGAENAGQQQNAEGSRKDKGKNNNRRDSGDSDEAGSKAAPDRERQDRGNRKNKNASRQEEGRKAQEEGRKAQEEGRKTQEEGRKAKNENRGKQNNRGRNQRNESQQSASGDGNVLNGKVMDWEKDEYWNIDENVMSQEEAKELQEKKQKDYRRQWQEAAQTQQDTE